MDAVNRFKQLTEIDRFERSFAMGLLRNELLALWEACNDKAELMGRHFAKREPGIHDALDSLNAKAKEVLGE